VLELGGLIAAFFKRLNRLAARRWLRNLLKLTGKPALEHYYRNYFASVAAGLTKWELEGRDVLFHGATAAIIVGTRPGAACPKEDALLATQNMLLGAHAMGLGSCLIGFAVSAFQNAPAIQGHLGIPAAEVVHAVAAIGYPDERYERLPGRKAVACRTWSP
jgi:nitroreductase